MQFMSEYGVERWMDDAACLFTSDPEMFFPKNETEIISTHVAKTYCATCAVVAECLQYATSQGIEHGVWGGLTSIERRKIRKG
jgi:WhiB family redox-sensing transcriptional regulator